MHPLTCEKSSLSYDGPSFPITVDIELDRMKPSLVRTSSRFFANHGANKKSRSVEMSSEAGFLGKKLNLLVYVHVYVSFWSLYLEFH